MKNNTHITSHTELCQRIEVLKADMQEQEKAIAAKFSSFADTLDPLNMLKRSLHNFVEDKEIQTDLVKAGIDAGSKILAAKLAGKSKRLRSILGSLIVANISPALIYSGISKLFSLFGNKKNEEAEKEEPEEDLLRQDH